MGPVDTGLSTGLRDVARPVSMAGERLLSVREPLGTLLPEPGLRRGAGLAGCGPGRPGGGGARAAGRTVAAGGRRRHLSRRCPRRFRRRGADRWCHGATDRALDSGMIVRTLVVRCPRHDTDGDARAFEPVVRTIET